DDAKIIAKNVADKAAADVCVETADEPDTYAVTDKIAVETTDEIVDESTDKPEDVTAGVVDSTDESRHFFLRKIILLFYSY
uniref:Uncharacterized protein n=1 Tax=Panagrolaimus sp. ES5 TaxID=591445 RepID=A0AC34FAR7_9BILA